MNQIKTCLHRTLHSIYSVRDSTHSLNNNCQLGQCFLHCLGPHTELGLFHNLITLDSSSSSVGAVGV